MQDAINANEDADYIFVQTADLSVLENNLEIGAGRRLEIKQGFHLELGIAENSQLIFAPATDDKPAGTLVLDLLGGGQTHSLVLYSLDDNAEYVTRVTLRNVEILITETDYDNLREEDPKPLVRTEYGAVLCLVDVCSDSIEEAIFKLRRKHDDDTKYSNLYVKLVKKTVDNDNIESAILSSYKDTARATAEDTADIATIQYVTQTYQTYFNRWYWIKDDVVTIKQPMSHEDIRDDEINASLFALTSPFQIAGLDGADDSLATIKITELSTRMIAQLQPIVAKLATSSNFGDFDTILTIDDASDAEFTAAGMTCDMARTYDFTDFEVGEGQIGVTVNSVLNDLTIVGTLGTLRLEKKVHLTLGSDAVRFVGRLTWTGPARTPDNSLEANASSITIENGEVTYKRGEGDSDRFRDLTIKESSTLIFDSINEQFVYSSGNVWHGTVSLYDFKSIKVKSGNCVASKNPFCGRMIAMGRVFWLNSHNITFKVDQGGYYWENGKVTYVHNANEASEANKYKELWHKADPWFNFEKEGSEQGIITLKRPISQTHELHYHFLEPIIERNRLHEGTPIARLNSDAPIDALFELKPGLTLAGAFNYTGGVTSTHVKMMDFLASLADENLKLERPLFDTVIRIVAVAEEKEEMEQDANDELGKFNLNDLVPSNVGKRRAEFKKYMQQYTLLYVNVPDRSITLKMNKIYGNLDLTAKSLTLEGITEFYGSIKSKVGNAVVKVSTLDKIVVSSGSFVLQQIGETDVYQWTASSSVYDNQYDFSYSFASSDKSALTFELGLARKVATDQAGEASQFDVKDLLIKANSHLTIKQGVKVSSNLHLKFEPADSDAASVAGTLAFQLDNAQDEVRLELNEQASLLIRRLDLIIGEDFKYSEFTGNLQLIEAGENNPHENFAICLDASADVCTVADGDEIEYRIDNVKKPKNPDLVVYTTDNRAKLYVRKALASDSSLGVLTEILSVSDAATSDESFFGSSVTSELFSEITKTAVLLNFIPNIADGHSKVEAISFSQGDSESKKQNALVDLNLPKGTNLQATADVNAGWISAGEMNSSFQNFKLSMSGRYQQVVGELSLVYAQMQLGEVTTRMIGGLVQVSYLPPVQGLLAGGYFGAAAEPKAEGEIAILSGLNIAYRIQISRVIGISFAPLLGLDFLPILKKVDSTTNVSLKVHAQGGVKVGIDTLKLLGENYQLELAIPLYFGAHIRKDLATSEAITSYLIYGRSGLNAKTTIMQNFVLQLGYGFKINNKLAIEHSLNFQFQFKM